MKVTERETGWFVVESGKTLAGAFAMKSEAEAWIRTREQIQSHLHPHD